jgi:hypothetical protein
MTAEINAIYIKSFIKSTNIPFAPTQATLCVPIILRICHKMAHGIKFDDIKICDDLIIDGHHRYLSALIMKYEMGKVFSHKTSATKAIDWKAVELDENDWDTQAKIAHLNEQDAKYNNLDVEFVNKITSLKY